MNCIEKCLPFTLGRLGFVAAIVAVSILPAPVAAAQQSAPPEILAEPAQKIDTAELASFARWMTKVNAIYEGLMPVFLSVSQIEGDILRRVQGQISRGELEARTAPLLDAAHEHWIEADRRMRALPDPPPFRRDSRLGPLTVQQMKWTVAKAASLANQAQRGVSEALAGDFSNTAQRAIAQVETVVAMAGIENHRLKLQNMMLPPDTPQFHLNDVVRFGNSAILFYAENLASLLRSNRVNLERNRRWIAQYLDLARRSVDKGKLAIDRYRGDFPPSVAGNPRLERVWPRLIPLYAEALDIERRIIADLSRTLPEFLAQIDVTQPEPDKILERMQLVQARAAQLGGELMGVVNRINAIIGGAADQ